MKKTILTLTFALAMMTFSNAQKIEMEKVFGGYKYTQNGNLMTIKDLAQTMEPNQEAFALLKKAQSETALASVIGFVGGGLLGWPVGTALGGGEANWTLAGIGAGLIAVGIPIASAANKKAKDAIKLYNAALKTTAFYSTQPEFKIISNQNGIGLSIQF